MRPFQLHMADQWVHTVQYWRAFARHSVGNANAIRRGAVADFRLHHGFSVNGSWFWATIRSCTDYPTPFSFCSPRYSKRIHADVRASFVTMPHTSSSSSDVRTLDGAA